MRRPKKRTTNRREAVHYPIAEIERLGNLIDEIELQDRASRGELEKIVPVKARIRQKLPPDFVEEQDLVEASPLPLSDEARADLINESISQRPVPKGK